ncbi:MAG TPA: HNH endonuclease [Archangium sp.]|uniref:HNH endonuclease n=1 Tax=Archangium sp. TaxID=1872627 RepID=UPI002E335DFD|nr:HNH endonuclease [Archangium sp.]HEX5752999.1 HNH endonuclease [Archangium sp.]
MGKVYQELGQKHAADKVRQAEAELGKLDAAYAELAADAALTAGSFAPPPFGTAADIASLAKSVAKGDVGGALLDIVGFIPVVDIVAKGGIRGTKIAAKMDDVAQAISAAKTALARQKSLLAAKTMSHLDEALKATGDLYNIRKAAARQYWDKVVAANRKKVDDELAKCAVKKCPKKKVDALNARKGEANPGRLPSSDKGKWVDPKTGKPVPPGTGNYVPDPEKNPSLHAALKKYGKENEGIPFKDGHPDFTSFAQKGPDGKPVRVEIDMKGNDTDFSSARAAAQKKYGAWDKGKNEKNVTWHHEPDGVTMTLIDRDIHTAMRKADGTANSGTPHVGGDSMWGNPEF